MIRIMDSKRSVLTDSLSVPKIIGKGPIMDCSSSPNFSLASDVHEKHESNSEEDY